MSARNKHLLCRFVEDVLNHGKLQLIETLVSPDHVLHGADGDLYGQEGVRIAVMEYRTGFPDLHITLDDFVEDGHWIACRILLRGTHSGPYCGLAGSGSPVELTGTLVNRIERHRLVESWISIDGLALAGQLATQPAESRT